MSGKGPIPPALLSLLESTGATVEDMEGGRGSLPEVGAEPMTFTPILDRLLVRVIDPERRTPGGLIIPEIALANTPARFAEVMEAGTGRMTATGEIVPMSVKKGDVVFFFLVSQGEQFEYPALDGSAERWRVIREAHVVGVVGGLKRASSLIGASGAALVMPS